MKSRTFLSFVIILTALLFPACNEDDADPLLSKADQNARLLTRVLDENQSTLMFVTVYEHNPANGGWTLAANSQLHSEGETYFRVEDKHFYLNGSGTKVYPTGATPSHQLSGYYYFDLEYLVSFEMGTDRSHLYLYFKY